MKCNHVECKNNATLAVGIRIGKLSKNINDLAIFDTGIKVCHRHRHLDPNKFVSDDIKEIYIKIAKCQLDFSNVKLALKRL